MFKHVTLSALILVSIAGVNIAYSKAKEVKFADNQTQVPTPQLQDIGHTVKNMGLSEPLTAKQEGNDLILLSPNGKKCVVKIKANQVDVSSGLSCGQQ